MCCSQVFSWRRTGPILLTNVSCRHCSFLVQLTICWAYFSDVMVWLGLRKPEWSNGEQTTKQWPWPFFDASLTLGSALELLLSPTHWAGHCQFFFFFIKSTLCCTSQSEKWFAVVMQNKRKWHFKTRHPLIELFHLSNLLQMPNGYRMVDAEFFCNFLCSCYKDQLRWLLSIGHCQLLMAGYYTPDLKGSCLLCKTSWTTTALYVC